MFNIFSKPDPKELMRENDKALRKAGREIEREKLQLEREEKKIELEIKKLAREGNKEGCAILAKQLLQLRKQKTRTYAATSKIQSVSTQSKTMGANVKLAGAMGTTSKVLGEMNKVLRPEKVAMDARKFSEASTKLQFTDDMINDTMDDILAESDDEEESDRIISQVLDEIGIETSGKLRQAPTPAAVNPIANDADDDIIAKLEKLKS